MCVVSFIFATEAHTFSFNTIISIVQGLPCGLTWTFLAFCGASFSFCFEGGMWDLIILVPDNCFSFFFL